MHLELKLGHSLFSFEPSVPICVWIYENRLKDCTKIAGMFLENRSDIYTQLKDRAHVIMIHKPARSCNYMPMKEKKSRH